MYMCFWWKSPSLESSSSPLMSHIHTGLGFRLPGWKNLEKHSCKWKSWAIWAFSTLPAICGEKEFLNYVKQCGRVGAVLCLYSCSLALLCSHGPEVSANVPGKGFQRLEEVRTGLGTWLTSICLGPLIGDLFKENVCFLKTFKYLLNFHGSKFKL